MQFYKHMCNMRHDVKVDRLMSKYGLEGYGLYCLILECIVDKLDAKSPYPDLEEKSADIARKYNADTVRIEEIMLFCINQGLFDQDEITGRLVCHKVYKFLDNSMTSSKQLREMIANYKEKHGVMTNHDESCDIMTGSGHIMNRLEENRKEKIRLDSHDEISPVQPPKSVKDFDDLPDHKSRQFKDPENDDRFFKADGPPIKTETENESQDQADSLSKQREELQRLAEKHKAKDPENRDRANKGA